MLFGCLNTLKFLFAKDLSIKSFELSRLGFFENTSSWLAAKPNQPNLAAGWQHNFDVVDRIPNVKDFAT